MLLSLTVATRAQRAHAREIIQAFALNVDDSKIVGHTSITKVDRGFSEGRAESHGQSSVEANRPLQCSH